jgi:hypothetical protein
MLPGALIDRIELACLYIISEHPDGPIKIGRSKSVKSRMSSLQTGNCRQLTLEAVFTMPADQVVLAERCLHEELENRALIGEWFDLPTRFMREYMPDFFLANGFDVIT